MLPTDKDTDGVSFIWTIHNFKHCVQKTGEYIDSPCFNLVKDNTEKFILQLFPRGIDKNHEDAIAFRLQRQSTFQTIPSITVTCVLSIRSVKGEFKIISDKVLCFVGGFIYNEDFDFLSLKKIHKKGADALLDNDILTVRCRIYKKDGIMLNPRQCYAQTRIDVEKVTYNWKFRDFGILETERNPNMSEMASFPMSVRLLDTGDFEVMILQDTVNNKTFYLTCEFALLDTDKVIKSALNEHWFEKYREQQHWIFSFTPKIGIFVNPERNSTISLCCVFSVSSGIYYNKLEKIVHGSTVDRPLECSRPTTDFDNSWKFNLCELYSKAKFTDLTIRTPTNEFRVHKAILCAQSLVFTAMFEGDMKEKRTGIVEINDIEDDTISMMLLFIYSGKINNHANWEMTSKLYFAADKYLIMSLKEKCADYLKRNLNTLSACKCLVFAEMLHDDYLKSVAENYIINCSPNIISSAEWSDLMKEHPVLAAETMKLIIVQNNKP